MNRIHNFSSGPSCLPEEVLREIRDEMLDWRDSGMSVLEMPFSCPEYRAIAAAAERDLRELLEVPASHRILFLQGGAYAHFGILAMNLLAPGRSADYVVTGLWSERAAAEARRHGAVRIAASAAREGCRGIPPRAGWQLDPAAAYCHLTTNETAHGVQFHELPDTGAVPLVADMSSTILSRPVDVRKFGVIYAGAQKNIGPAGLVLMIVRKDLLERVPETVPPILRYASQAKEGSMLNTPPTYSWYIAGLVFQWLKQRGGLAAMEKHNREKAGLLYACLDQSKFFVSPVAKADRSLMNVPFTLKNAELDEEFLKGAKARGMVQLKGHRSVGGMRASIYNAMPVEGVKALVDYMKEFEAKHG